MKLVEPAVELPKSKEMENLVSRSFQLSNTAYCIKYATMQAFMGHNYHKCGFSHPKKLGGVW